MMRRKSKSLSQTSSFYNYGYRDYSPQTVRFTTVDPIRDGSNWFAYVNNDPVNYVDLWGLLASENDKIASAINTIKNTQFGKSEDGKKVVEHLSKMNEGEKITIEKNPRVFKTMALMTKLGYPMEAYKGDIAGISVDDLDKTLYNLKKVRMREDEITRFLL